MQGALSASFWRLHAVLSTFARAADYKARVQLKDSHTFAVKSKNTTVRRRGGCRRVGLEQRVLHAAAPHHKVPANGTRQTRGERGGGRRDGGNGGPTRWGERGAAVGRCAGRWTGVRGLGCCGAGRTSHGGRQTPSRKRRACQKARKTGVGVWVSMRGGVILRSGLAPGSVQKK